MHGPARETLTKTADYLRVAILRLADPTGTLEKTLTLNKWAKPRGPTKLSKKIHGTLKGPPDGLAAEGNSYPAFVWRTRLKEVTIGSNGLYEFVPDENLTAHFGKDVTATLDRIEVYDENATPFNNGLVAPNSNPIVTVEKRVNTQINRVSRLIDRIFKRSS